MVVTPGNKRGGIEDADCLQRSSHVRVVHLSLLHDRQGAVGPHSTDDHTDHAPQERAAEEGCVGKQSSGGGGVECKVWGQHRNRDLILQTKFDRVCAQSAGGEGRSAAKTNRYRETYGRKQRRFCRRLTPVLPFAYSRLLFLHAKCGSERGWDSSRSISSAASISARLSRAKTKLDPWSRGLLRLASASTRMASRSRRRHGSAPRANTARHTCFFLPLRTTSVPPYFPKCKKCPFRTQAAWLLVLLRTDFAPLRSPSRPSGGNDSNQHHHGYHHPRAPIHDPTVP